MEFYGPKPEEIRVGMDIYYQKEDGTIDPKPLRVHAGNISQVLNEIVQLKDSHSYRIKHLDNQDIIDLGWHLEGELKSGSQQFSKSNSNIGPTDYPKMFLGPSIVALSFEPGEHEEYKVKNKYELEQLEKMLDIDHC